MISGSQLWFLNSVKNDHVQYLCMLTLFKGVKIGVLVGIECVIKLEYHVLAKSQLLYAYNFCFFGPCGQYTCCLDFLNSKLGNSGDSLSFSSLCENRDFVLNRGSPSYPNASLQVSHHNGVCLYNQLSCVFQQLDVDMHF